MPILYVRDVPEGLHEKLRARARRNGRSLNAEVLAILEQTGALEDDAVEVTRRLEEIARRVKLPLDAPRPEDLIRRARDDGH